MPHVRPLHSAFHQASTPNWEGAVLPTPTPTASTTASVHILHAPLHAITMPHHIHHALNAAPATSAPLGCAWLRRCALHLNGLQPQPQSGLLQHAGASVLHVSLHLELQQLGAAAPAADAVLKTLCALCQLNLAAAATSVSAAASAFASLVWWAWQHLLSHSDLVPAVCAKQCML